MKVKEISVSFKFTKNLGNYQSAAVEAGLVVEIQGGESPDEVMTAAFEKAKEHVRTQLNQINGGLK